MFYRLIFNTSINGIVLIDEPEISLHIEWQEDYLDRLIDICQMNGLQAIVATHSPNIVNGHFDLFVDKGELSMAGNPFDETARLANLLAAHAKLKFDYSAFLKKERKLIIVEGSTDKEFISNVKSESVDCIVASSVFNGNASFRTSATESVNCKKAIVQIIQGVSRYPSFIIQKPNDIDKWDLYGMVDLDVTN